MAIEDLTKGISNIKTMVGAVIFLFMAILGFIVWYPVYTVIRGWTTNTYLSAIMFICFWTACTILIYFGVVWKIEGDDISRIK